ncbi:MAG: hypothetical protein QG640_110 [Patescibacteria group bacterium]|nr:hypothetical protein [Patescibacteria group bacterium]
MKKFSIFESAIIGLLVGVVISAYMTFVVSMEGFIGKILSWISLKPLLDMLEIPDERLLLISFLYFVLVYIIYGAIIGLLVRNSKKASIAAFIALFALAAGTVFEQVNGTAAMVNNPTVDYFTASVVNSVPRIPKQYFGNEALGDLNADGRDDVAFIIRREDDDRGVLYYLTTALASENGRQGTNLIFLGEKIQPENIMIENGIISIAYTDLSNLESTTTLVVSAQVVDGNLVQNK